MDMFHSDLNALLTPGICLVCNPRGTLACKMSHPIQRETALIAACLSGSTDTVEYLLQRGASVSARDEVRSLCVCDFLLFCMLVSVFVRVLLCDGKNIVHTCDGCAHVCDCVL